MTLTTENIIRIQQFLLERGFIQDVADGVWNFNKSSGYKTYLETKGLPLSEVIEVPHKLEMLTLELQEYLNIPDSITTPLDTGDEKEEDFDITLPEESTDEVNSEVDSDAPSIITGDENTTLVNTSFSLPQ